MPDLRARRATEADADLLLRWRNDPVTRRWSRIRDPVALDDHRRWLASVLTDPDRLLLVVERDGEPVGTVRLDRHEPAWEVSITLAPEHRGRGLAAEVLAAGEAQVSGVTVVASVHRDNAASLALFRRAGYLERPEPGPFAMLTKAL